MSHKTRKKKKIWQWSIGIIIILLVVTFIYSRHNKQAENQKVEKQVEIGKLQKHIKGNKDSKIILVEYSDFQCPACAAREPMVTQLVNDYGDNFQLEFRHFPLRSIHPNAQIAAQAAEAAGLQGKFWEMHDKLFMMQREWSTSYNPKVYFKKYAQEIGIDAQAFLSDMYTDAIKDSVNESYDEAVRLGLPGTPSFVFNGKKIDINTFISENLITEQEKEVI